MARKSKTVFVCQQCGGQSTRWAGRCAECGAWNSLVETAETEAAPGLRGSNLPRSQPVALPNMATRRLARITLPIQEFDRVLGGGIVPGSVVLVGGDPGIGKCVTADTRVLDPETGAYEPITAWSECQRAVLAIDEESLRLSPATPSRFHSRGVHPIVEVTTRLGRALRCTPTHPVLTPEGWRPIGELAAGCRIAAPRSLPYFGDEEMSDAAVKLIAYILSDGSAQSAISITSDLPEVARDLSEIAKAFHVRLVAYPKRGTSAQQYGLVSDDGQRAAARREVALALHRVKQRADTTWQEWARRAQVSHALLNVLRRGEGIPDEDELRRLAAAVGSPLVELRPEARDHADQRTPIARFLERHGLRHARAVDKRVPASVFRLPRAQLATFLKVLFSCDGSVYVSGTGRLGLSYSTISRRLAEDVQHLLLRFGLVARLRTRRSQVAGRPCTAYEVELHGVPALQRFLAEIDIYGREQARAAIAAAPEPCLSSSRKDTVPTGERFWRELTEGLGGRAYAELSRQAGVTLKNRRHDRPLCRSTIARLADALGSARLDALASGDVYWDEIVGVKPAGEAPVYDLTVPGQASFVANDLIVHNSTLLLQVSNSVAEGVGPVLYVSGEESADQIRLRAERLSIRGERLFVLGETCLDSVLGHVESLSPSLVVVDSIQTMYLEGVPSAAGSITQVRECAMALLRLAKATDVPMFLVGHVTKEGAIAGPRVLEHIVDTVLYLEGERFHTYRLLRSVKNRFGSTNEIGVFEMQEAGMVEVDNPSAIFLAERLEMPIGSAVAVTLEGTRPLLVEVQALTTTTSFGLPRRTGNGIDLSRLLLLTAVLSKQVGLALSSQDIYVNVVGGLKVSEPAVDLAVSLAIASSFKDRPVAPDMVAIGEVGLSGEIRRIGQVERRLAEAGKLGFKRCVLPRGIGSDRLAGSSGVELIGARTLAQALEAALEPQ